MRSHQGSLDSRIDYRLRCIRVEQMRSILKLSTLPDVGVEALDDTEVDLGVKLDWLKDAKAQLENLNVDELEHNINKSVKRSDSRARGIPLAAHSLLNYCVLITGSKAQSLHCSR